MKLSENGKKALVATGLFLPLLLLLITLVEMPDAAVGGDGAVLELRARQTARGENLLGPYSRFHFNHPGPLYFLLMLPLYWLSGETHGSLLFTAALINLASVFVIFLASRKLTWLPFLTTTAMLSLYLGHLGPGTLRSVWNPDVTILPFAAAVFSLAAGVSGRPDFFFAALAMLSFVVQSHVAYTTSAALMGLAAVCLCLFPKLTCMKAKHPVGWRRTAALALFLLVLWSPSLYEELTSQGGNLSRMVIFFTLGHEPQPTDLTLRIWGEQLIGFLPDGLVSTELGVALQPWLSWALVLGLPVAFFFSRRRGQALAASLSLLCFAGLMGALFSVNRIVGPVHNYLVPDGRKRDRLHHRVSRQAGQGLERTSI